MTDAWVPEADSLDSLVARVADEFLERQKRGERPTVEEYADRHPQAAALLRKVLTSLELLGLSRRWSARAGGSERRLLGSAAPTLNRTPNSDSNRAPDGGADRS